MELEQLKKEVQKFFGDQSRTREETKEQLEELQGDIETYIEALED